MVYFEDMTDEHRFKAIDALYDRIAAYQEFQDISGSGSRDFAGVVDCINHCIPFIEGRFDPVSWGFTSPEAQKRWCYRYAKLFQELRDTLIEVFET